MAVFNLSVGAYEVSVFFDGTYSDPITVLTHADTDRRAQAIAGWGKESFAVDVNCFGLRGPDGLVLIDAGTGDYWGPDYGKAPAAMQQAGFAPEDVRVVLLTHLHGDHSLGLLVDDKARYPNAEIKAPQGDLSYYGDPANIDITPEDMRGSFRNLALLQSAYGDRLSAISVGPVLAGISAIALPGHTPGHTGFLVHDDRKSLLIWGDVIHLDALQLADPGFGLGSDIDPELARNSRQTALEEAANEACYVAGGHITGIRRIVRSGKGFAFAEENP